MSISTTNHFKRKPPLTHLKEVVGMLDYKYLGPGEYEGVTWSSYMWHETEDYRSWTGVELQIYDNTDGTRTVSTRTRAGRSHYDLIQQNRTAKVIRMLFGGYFTSDEGVNRYFPVEDIIPPPEASGCFLAYHRFKNLVESARWYINNRTFPDQIMKQDPLMREFGFSPPALSVNALLPFLVSSLEDYFKSTFTALAPYSPNREAILRQANLRPEHLLRLLSGDERPWFVVSDSFSFQKLPSIHDRFRSINPKIDLRGELLRPYRNRAKTLWASIEELIEARHRLIHRAEIDYTLTDARVERLCGDLLAAATRFHKHIRRIYSWPVGFDWDIY